MSVRNLIRSKTYLTGQIENDPKCMDWRTKLAADLIKIEPEIIVWNPLIKPDWMGEDARHESLAFDKKAMFPKWSGEVHNPDVYLPTIDTGVAGWRANLEIRKVCKKLASSCDFMIARITKTFTWGSIDELEIAASQNKPVFFWFPEGPVSTYGIPGCIPNYNLVDDYVFYNYEDLLGAIQKVSDGSSKLLVDDPFAWTFLTYTNAARII